MGLMEKRKLDEVMAAALDLPENRGAGLDIYFADCPKGGVMMVDDCDEAFRLPTIPIEAATPEVLVLVNRAYRMAYRSGTSLGRSEMQRELRNLLGVPSSDDLRTLDAKVERQFD